MGGNLYLTYKNDTSRLLYWVINTSNGILRSSTTAEDSGVAINTTGQTTVSEIVNMSKLIAKYLQPVPSTVFNLFQAVIKARSTMHDAFREIVKQVPDPEIEKSNATHKHFIDALTEAFHALGGVLGSSSESDDDNDDNFVQLKLQNQFSVLSLGLETGDGEADVLSEDDSRQPQTQKKKKAARGKKGKRSKKSKQKTAPKPTEKAPLANVPVESYRIIDDKDGLVSEYLLAVRSIIQEWIDLRDCVQGLWNEVAYDGLNGAVAVSMTNMAVACVKQTCFAVFVDFPGHESYETIMKTITRGDPDKAQGIYITALWHMSADGKPEKVQETAVDVREQFFIHTYDNLVAFVTDFQKNRSGKPSKAMQAQINDWNPTMDLQRATNDERISWRRSYTINWLYDLVNVFSCIVVQRNTMKGEHHAYEDVDWSRTGPWNQHRRLFGLNEFAEFVTTLAMQKPNTDIREKILPHHVFQLQCIVDSMTASRGWTLNALRGHIVNPPPPVGKFYPRRDVDLFLDRDFKQYGRGILQATELLKLVLEKDAQERGSNSYRNQTGLLDDIKFDFLNWLGESKYMHGLATIPPSRFSKHNTNGLWEYSPLLCAAGLVEGLVIVQRISMMMWDQIPEPTLALHLHNMLVQTGYLQNPVGLYAALEDLLKDSFFPDGVPTSMFKDELVKKIASNRQRQAVDQTRQAVARDKSKDIHQLTDANLNYIFRDKTALMMYYDADWVPDRIPDSEVQIPSTLLALRLRRTKRMTDPLTGETRFEQTELVKRSKARGMSDEDLLGMGSLPDPEKDVESPSALRRLLDVPKDYKISTHPDPYRVENKKKANHHHQFQGRDLLDVLRIDIFADVCGGACLSAFNYVLVTAVIMMLFSEIEQTFEKTRHPMYVQVCAQFPPSERRLALVMGVLKNEDEDAMKICAGVFEKQRGRAFDCTYWEDQIRVDELGLKPREDKDEATVDSCSVM